MKTILVTGATGFIGSYVVQELVKKGYSVVATSFQPEKAETRPWYPSVRYIPFDMHHVQEGADYYSFFGKPDKMIHLAWEGLPNYRSSFHLDSNLPRHFSFLSSFIKNGLKDLTVTGTCFEYGMQEGCLSEDLPALPDNPYAQAKHQLNLRLQELRRDYHFDLKWVRLFYMYGRGQNPNSILLQLEKALANGDEIFNMSGGEQLRDYLPVTTVAEYIVRIAVQDKVQGIINCCSGQPISIKELVQDYLLQNEGRIRLNLGHYPYTDYEPMAFWGSAEKLRRILDNDTSEV